MIPQARVAAGAIIVLGVGVAVLYARKAAADAGPHGGGMLDLFAGSWKPPSTAAPYVDACRQAAIDNGLPLDLITRMCQQESGFRKDVINGHTLSPAGAVGILQIIPRYHPSVDPLDAYASIDYCASWIADQRQRLGSLAKAVAAWNTGPANVRRLWPNRLPAETRNYISRVLTDVAPQELLA